MPFWSPNRDRVKQRRYRNAVLKRDGYRCTAIEDGKRCPVMWDLRAHHLIPLSNYEVDDPKAYAVSNGITLCGKHDREADRRAR